MQMFELRFSSQYQEELICHCDGKEQSVIDFLQSNDHLTGRDIDSFIEAFRLAKSLGIATYRDGNDKFTCDLEEYKVWTTE